MLNLMKELDNINAEIWGTDPTNPDELSEDTDDSESDNDATQTLEPDQLTTDGINK